MRKLLLFSLLIIAFNQDALASTMRYRSKLIKGYLVDFKTRRNVDEVSLLLVSKETGERFKAETRSGVFTFKNNICGLGALNLTIVNCKPIDTRTPKQKAVEEMKKLLDGKWCSNYAEILYDAGYRKC